jgi:hypothetical protein
LLEKRIEIQAVGHGDTRAEVERLAEDDWIAAKKCLELIEIMQTRKEDRILFDP